MRGDDHVFKVFPKLFLFVDDVAPIANDDEIIDLILNQTRDALIGMAILMVAIVVVMIIASKIGLEDFDYIDYFVMSLGIFIATYLWYIILAITLNGLVHQGVFSADDRIQLRAFVFVSSIVFLFGPIVFILKSSFMFIRPRLILAGIYSVMIATALSIVILN